jgi:hypothetical protein
MARHDNYPDDIRSYDNDPRSPFYAGELEIDPADMDDKAIEELTDDPEQIPEYIFDSKELYTPLSKLVSTMLDLAGQAPYNENAHVANKELHEAVVEFNKKLVDSYVEDNQESLTQRIIDGFTE